MKRLIKLVSVCLLGVSAIAVAKPVNYGDVKAVYVKNYDGDTMTVNIPGYPGIVGKKMKIRVAGIDTPEIKGNCKKEKALARQGKKLVASMFRSTKDIELKNMYRGKYFRIVADVYVNGKSVGQTLIKNHLAVPYDGGKKTKNWCRG